MTFSMYSQYRKTDGMFVPGVVSSSVPPKDTDVVGHLDGAYDHASQKVDVGSGTVVDYQPPSPSADHEWNAATKRWILSAAATTRAAQRLNAIKRIAFLEAQQARPVRELTRDPQNVEARKRIDAIDAEIAALRSDL